MQQLLKHAPGPGPVPNCAGDTTAVAMTSALSTHQHSSSGRCSSAFPADKAHLFSQHRVGGLVAIAGPSAARPPVAAPISAAAASRAAWAPAAGSLGPAVAALPCTEGLSYSCAYATYLNAGRGDTSAGSSYTKSEIAPVQCVKFGAACNPWPCRCYLALHSNDM